MMCVTATVRGFFCAHFFALLAAGQPAPVAQLHHVYTFGSKHGIHPAGILNRKTAKAALGNPENPYGLVFPVSVTTDLNGRIWITDTGTASVHVFDQASSGYREIRRLDEVKLQQPSGLVTDRSGRVYLTDSGTGGIYVLDEHGEYDRSLFTHHQHPLEGPTAIALSEDNRTIYVADPPRNAILEFNREGEVNGQIALPPELSGPLTIQVLHNQIYVLSAQSHKVAIFTPGGRQRGELKFDGVPFPTAFAFDPARGMSMVANPRWMVVQAFDEEGRNCGVFGQLGDGVDQVRGIDFLHVDRKGWVYVVDSRHGKVLVFGDAQTERHQAP